MLIFQTEGHVEFECVQQFDTYQYHCRACE